VRRKTSEIQRVNLINIQNTKPLEILCTDFLSLERSTSGFENVSVITDHFTRFGMAVPTTNSKNNSKNSFYAPEIENRGPILFLSFCLSVILSSTKNFNHG
jgi:hypothetical protein